MSVYRLKDLRSFFPVNPENLAFSLNEMVRKSKDGTLKYFALGKPDVGVYSFMAKKGRPFVLVLPGGAYGDVCSLVEGYATAIRLNELGYNAFIGNYRVGRAAAVGKPLGDVADILKFIFSHKDLFGESDDYAVCGFSAGGHLAACWGCENVGYKRYGLPKPSCLFLAYPAIDMGQFADNKVRRIFLGKMCDDEKTEKEYSVEFNVTASYPKTFLWQCERDKVLAFKHFQLMDKALSEAHVTHHSESFPSDVHGWGLGDGTLAEGWLNRAVAFWRD